MRLINQFNGSFPASFARVDNRYPMSRRSRTGYMRRKRISYNTQLPINQLRECNRESAPKNHWEE